MKSNSVAFFALLFLIAFSGCGKPVATDPNTEVNQPVNTGASGNANSPAENRERLRIESEQLKKDLDELEKKIANANQESNALQEQIRQAEREINETKKKIK